LGGKSASKCLRGRKGHKVFWDEKRDEKKNAGRGKNTGRGGWCLQLGEGGNCKTTISCVGRRAHLAQGKQKRNKKTNPWRMRAK